MGKNLKFWVFFLLALLVLGGVVVWQRWQQGSYQAQIPSGTKNVATATIDTSTSSTALTASWKTYRNEQYGFEVKYPKDWVAEEGKNFVNFESFQTKQAREENMSNCRDDDPNTVCRLDFAPMDIVFYGHVPTFNTQPSPKTKTVINNITFERYEADLPPESHDVYYETSVDGDVYVFRVAPDEEDTLTRLLASFRFIPPTSSVDISTSSTMLLSTTLETSTAGWKTYQYPGNSYGYTGLGFKYPPSGRISDSGGVDVYFKTSSSSGASLYFNVYDEPVFTSIEGFIKRDGQGKGKKVTKILIGDKEWVRIFEGAWCPIDDWGPGENPLPSTVIAYFHFMDEELITKNFRRITLAIYTGIACGKKQGIDPERDFEAEINMAQTVLSTLTFTK